MRFDRRSRGSLGARRARPWLAALAAVGVALGAAPPASADETAEELGEQPAAQSSVGFDAVVIPETMFEVALLRPLGALATAAGFPLFLVSVPFMAPSGEIDWAWDVFVMAPYEYTFERPFREF